MAGAEYAKYLQSRHWQAFRTSPANPPVFKRGIQPGYYLQKRSKYDTIVV